MPVGVHKYLMEHDLLTRFSNFVVSFIVKLRAALSLSLACSRKCIGWKLHNCFPLFMSHIKVERLCMSYILYKYDGWNYQERNEYISEWKMFIFAIKFEAEEKTWSWFWGTTTREAEKIHISRTRIENGGWNFPFNPFSLSLSRFHPLYYHIIDQRMHKAIVTKRGILWGIKI